MAERERIDSEIVWEFPGGKLEPGENAYEALVREFQEELGVLVLRARRLVDIPFQYPDKEVMLIVWRVLDYYAKPASREGQQLLFLNRSELRTTRTLQANHRIVQML